MYRRYRRRSLKVCPNAIYRENIVTEQPLSLSEHPDIPISRAVSDIISATSITQLDDQISLSIPPTSEQQSEQQSPTPIPSIPIQPIPIQPIPIPQTHNDFLQINYVSV